MKTHQLLRLPPARGLAVGVIALCGSLAASATDMGGIAIHGSLSGTAAYSPEYNYLGDTKDSLDLNQVELILNGTRRFDNGLKLAAQIYAYELAGYEDLSIDFANIDYSFREEIGVRIGRNKLIGGLYTDVQDLDQVRTFASLPLNFYGRATRAFASCYEGGEFYGNIPAGRAGSVEYQIYGGVMQPLDPDMPFMKGLPAEKFELNGVYGDGIRWNTPIKGLRLGYTHQLAPDINFERGIAEVDTDFRADFFGAEYTWGKWVAAVEYRRSTSKSNVVNFPVPTRIVEENHTYVQLAYQVTDRLGLGVYYAHSDFEGRGVDQDTAFATSYAIEPWWLVKAEVHFMDGITNLGHAGDLNPGASDETWNYFVLKTTVSF